MTEKEFHKMRSQDLVQLLLAQGIEVANLQGDLEKKIEQLGLLRADNDVLKMKLDERDERIEQLKKGLDESDAYIRELEEEMASLKADRWIDLEETGSLVDAAQEITKIFQAAQKEAEMYLSGELQPQIEEKPPKPRKDPSTKKRHSRERQGLLAIESSKGDKGPTEGDNRKNLEKESPKLLKSDRKTSDKVKEKLEEARLQQPETEKEGSEGAADAAAVDTAAALSRDFAAEAIQDALPEEDAGMVTPDSGQQGTEHLDDAAAEDSWPDEVPPKGKAQEAPEDPWPDEAVLAEGAVGQAQQTEPEGARQKGLFHRLRLGKNRQKKEKSKKT